MTIRIDGTNTAANPGITGTDTDTGLQFGTDEVNIVTGGSTRTTVDSSGRLLVGTSTSRAVGSGGQASIQIETTTGNVASFINNFAGNAGAVLSLGHSRTTTIGSNTLLNDGDQLGEIRFAGADGTDIQSFGASIGANVDGTPGANDMPGRLVFSTTADGASSPTERMRITSTGDLRFNSGYGSVATAYGVRAWVNFQGTSTVAIRADGNVSSITDNGTGVYRINFTTAMPDDNYSVVGSNIGSVHSSYATFVCADNALNATGSCDIELRNVTGSIVDQPSVNIIVCR